MKFLVWLFFFLGVLPVYGQHTTCGSDHVNRRLLNSSESFRKAQIKFEKNLHEISRSKTSTTMETYTIPVVVHVIHKGESEGSGTNISDAQIESAIDHLNTVYSGNWGLSVDMGVQFQLATLDPNCNSTNGINRVDGTTEISDYATSGITNANEIEVKALSKWPNSSYYNIWIVSEIEGNNGGAGFQGYAYFPGARADLDGAVMLYNSFGYDPQGSEGYNLKDGSIPNDPDTRYNATAVHEMGHAFNLYHTFEGDKGINGQSSSSVCPYEQNGCVNYNTETNKWEYKGDCCGDTPPHKRSFSNCITSESNSCDNDSSDELFVHNYMAYSSGICKNEFTNDQRTRVRASIEGPRSSLLASKAFDDPSPVPDPVAAQTAPATSSTGLEGLYTGISRVKFEAIDYSSSYPPYDSENGYLDNSSNCQAVATVTEGETHLLQIDILFTNSSFVKAWIDYNNDGAFNDTDELVLNSSGHTNTNSATVNITIPNVVNPSSSRAATSGTNFRMRIINDLNSISDASSSPTYGQVEDYGVVIKDNATLPIELEAFDVTSTANNARLNWSTSSELNSDYFEIQRSADGFTWEAVDQVTASGNSDEINRYEIYDKQVPFTTAYYRLKMVDTDNSFIYSPIREVSFNIEAKAYVYPNPVQDQLNIYSPNHDEIGISILDYSGQMVLHKVTSDKILNIADLPNGLYVVQLQDPSGNHLAIRRIVKQ